MANTTIPPGGGTSVVGLTGSAAGVEAAEPKKVPALTPDLKAGGAPKGPGSTASVSRAAPAVSLQAAKPWEDPSLAQLFPTEIDPRFGVDPQANRAKVVIDGKVEEAPGEVRSIFSKIARRTDAGLEPVHIGFEALTSVADVERAARSAEKAWSRGEGAWPTASPEARIAAVETFAARLEAKTDAIATLLMWEIGKPLDKAKEEVTRSVASIRQSVAAYKKLLSDSEVVRRTVEGGVTQYFRERPEPLGVVTCVAPFNYPINEFLTTLLPALMVGNVVIAKTPRFGVLANSLLAEDYAACFPAGTVSILPGEGRTVLPAVMKSMERDDRGKDVHPLVDALVFIGSEGVAKAIMSHHPAPYSLHAVLGLGAKNPAIVLDGADLKKIAKKLVAGALGFNGQRCTAEKIIHVPRAQMAELARLMSEELDKLLLGMPMDNAAFTPYPEDNKVSQLRAMIDEALAKGAQIANKKGGTGFYSIMRPAIVTGITRDMELAYTEQFGGIACLAPYDNLEEVFAWQKASPFRQQASVWGPEDAVDRVVARLKALKIPLVNRNMNCKRRDSIGFGAGEKSGTGVLSDTDTLLALTQKVYDVAEAPDALVGS